jgi:hypothetical protein
MAERNLTDLELERHLAGDLPEARFAQATEADRARLGELRAENEAFLREVDVDLEVKRIQQRVARAAPEKKSWWRWLLPAGALAAAAAAIFVFVRRGSDDPNRLDDDIQVKGDDVTLVVHLATADGSRRLASGDAVAAGDRLRFEVHAGHAGYVAVIGIDGSGAPTIYQPSSGHTPMTFDPAARLLPGAIELDATPGDERFFAVYSRTPFALDAIVSAFATNAALPAGVAKAEVVLRKK